MPETENASDIDRYLAAAAVTISKAPLCWLATERGSGGAPRPRPMGRLPPAPGDDAWTLRFITDARSDKAADIRRAESVALVFQRDAEDAFVALSGRARFGDRPAATGKWIPGYDPFFPTEEDKANAIFLTVEAARLDLWIRGITPEPFALKTTTLEREDGGGWRLATR